MNDGPYKALDASKGNMGTPVWNVKGPGIDRLVTGPTHIKTMQMAMEIAADLNIAYAAGRDAK